MILLASRFPVTIMVIYYIRSADVHKAIGTIGTVGTISTISTIIVQLGT